MRLLLRIDPVTVSEINQCFQVAEFSFLPHPFYFLEHRAKIGSSSSVDHQLFPVRFPFFCGMDHHFFLNKTVTLDQAYFPVLEKIFLFLQNPSGLSKETGYHFFFTGSGGIYGNYQFLQPVPLPGFERLYHGKISIPFHPIIISNRVKGILIQFHLLSCNSKTA